MTRVIGWAYYLERYVELQQFTPDLRMLLLLLCMRVLWREEAAEVEIFQVL